MDVTLSTPVAVFVNNSSGWNSSENVQGLHELFEAHGLPARIEEVQAGVNLAEKSRHAVSAGAAMVVAGGGDGTISAVASGVAGTDACLGVLPVGTLNHFARDLSIPLDLSRAAEVVATGLTTEVDVAEVNGKIFLNNSIIGLYPIYRFLKAETERRVGNKRLALLIASASILRRYPLLKVRLSVDGKQLERKTAYILVGNNRHGMEGYHLGLRDSLTEGKLWIYILKNRGRLGILRMLVKLLAGQFRGEEDFEIFPAEDVWVDANRGKKIGVALDGEVTVMETPLHYRTRPRALKVRVPRPS